LPITRQLPVATPFAPSMKVALESASTTRAWPVIASAVTMRAPLLARSPSIR
jgi:hypothetical protein